MSNDLKEVVMKKIEDLDNMAPGSEEHTRTTNDVARLYSLIQEDEKQKWEIELADIRDDDKVRDLERETAIRKEDNTRNWIQFGITTVVGIGTTLLTMAFWKNRYHEGLQFEKEGTYTAKGGAQSVMRHFPKLK